VRKWLHHSQAAGKTSANTVRLKQRGLFRMKEGQNWVPFEAEQYYTVDPPAFVWKATMRMSPFVWIKGRDMFNAGRGHMLIKLLGLIPVVNMKGPKLDQAVLQRYLSEITWFPSAAVSKYIRWEEVDALSARATITSGDVSASALFYFDESGRPTGLTAQRYRLAGSDFVLDTWETPNGEEREMGGLLIPAKAAAQWKLSTGDLPYARIEITEIEYNNPALY
jgi:hypothetical protein